MDTEDYERWRDSTTSGNGNGNGNFGIPQLVQDVPAGADVLTAFGDGRENTPATPVAGFRPLNILPNDGGPRGDRDLYQLNRLDPPGSLARRSDADRQPHPTGLRPLGPGQRQYRSCLLSEPRAGQVGQPGVFGGPAAVLAACPAPVA
jgi:hypothetical protein